MLSSDGVILGGVFGGMLSGEGVLLGGTRMFLYFFVLAFRRFY